MAEQIAPILVLLQYEIEAITDMITIPQFDHRLNFFRRSI